MNAKLVTLASASIATLAAAQPPPLLLTATAPEQGAAFGSEIAIEGDTLVTLAPSHDEVALQSGVGYVFSASTGDELRKLVAPDGYAQQFFGDSVDIHNGVIAVGDPYNRSEGQNTGAVYLFDADTAQLIRKINPPDPSPLLGFGSVVRLSGPHLVVGAPGDDANGTNNGSCYVYDVATGEFLRKLITDDGGNIGLFLDIDGDIAIAGSSADGTQAFGAGAVYVFDITTGEQTRKILSDEPEAGAFFGWSVAIDGTTALIGAVYRNDQGEDSGAAYLYNVLSGARLAKLLPDDGQPYHRFGYTVDLAGDTALVGAYYDNPAGFLNGAAYTFDTRTGAQRERYDALSPQLTTGFAKVVALSDEHVVIGSNGHDNPFIGANIGAVYLFDPPAPPHPADFNANGVVDAFDLAVLLASWGAADGDLDGDNIVTSADLAILIAAWG